MRKMIIGIENKHHVFYILHQGRKIGFYLSNKLAKTFFHYLNTHVLVDFEIMTKMKRIGNHKFYQVAYFNQIINLKPYIVHYDLLKLRQNMRDVLSNNQYYLFIDFEMTMPGYRDFGFKTEIIQAGYVLSEAKGEIILQDGYYVLPLENRTLSKRTKRFLNLDENAFFSQALKYQYFYEQLQKIIEQYQPKFVVWGKNDLSALTDSYEIQKQKPLTQDQDFIDLLKLHKDYYNLRDDLGLFKAYKTYYDVNFEQAHDAVDDALVTKYVFDAFLDYM